MFQITKCFTTLAYILLAIIWCCPSSVSNTHRRHNENTLSVREIDERRKHPLRLTTNIISQRLCQNDDASMTLSLKLRLRYANLGYEPLILYKSSNLIYRHTTSRNAEQAEAEQYITDYSLSIASSGGAKIDESSLNSLFVILRPGDEYKVDALNVVAIPVVPNAPKVLGAGLPPGQYVLQVTTSTWPELEEIAQELRGKWLQSGHLWYDSIKSAPMPFEIPPYRSVKKCSKH